LSSDDCKRHISLQCWKLFTSSPAIKCCVQGKKKKEESVAKATGNLPGSLVRTTQEDDGCRKIISFPKAIPFVEFVIVHVWTHVKSSQWGTNKLCECQVSTQKEWGLPVNSELLASGLKTCRRAVFVYRLTESLMPPTTTCSLLCLLWSGKFRTRVRPLSHHQTC
jgi:hypothetical protein